MVFGLVHQHADDLLAGRLHDFLSLLARSHHGILLEALQTGAPDDGVFRVYFPAHLFDLLLVKLRILLHSERTLLILCQSLRLDPLDFLSLLLRQGYLLSRRLGIYLFCEKLQILLLLTVRFHPIRFPKRLPCILHFPHGVIRLPDIVSKPGDLIPALLHIQIYLSLIFPGIAHDLHCFFLRLLPLLRNGVKILVHAARKDIFLSALLLLRPAVPLAPAGVSHKYRRILYLHSSISFMTR